jgi:hypothetical protein
MTHKPDSRYHVTRMHSASVNTTSIVIATTASLISTVLENICNHRIEIFPQLSIYLLYLLAFSQISHRRAPLINRFVAMYESLYATFVTQSALR